jgi:hypothetical protein
MTGYAFQLVPATPPVWINIGDISYEFNSVDVATLAEQGWLPLIYDPENSSLGYADPVAETRDDHQVAVAYALGTEQERTAATIVILKTQAHNLRRERRTQAELAGFTHNGHPLDSDRDSILRIANAAASALTATILSQSWETVWRCADEYNMPLDGPGMLSMQASLALHGQACHTASQNISIDIDAAETIEALEAIIAAIPTDVRWPK